MEKVRIGLVGCGLFGESHLQAFRAVRSAEIAALFDTDAERAQYIASEFRIPRVYSRVEEICADPTLHAIDVVTPEQAHREPVLLALQHGKHVFVEKPLALDLNHCKEMIAAADRAGRYLMVGQILRFETKYAMIKDEIASGRLGKVVSMHARRNRPKALLSRYGRTHPALENCIHDIDLMLWYTGASVKRVRGYGRSATGGKNHDVFWGILEFDNGALGVVETIWLIPQAAGVMLDDSMQVIGDKGIANVQLVPGSLTYWREEGGETPDVCYDPRVAASARGALREELSYFCDCVLDGQPPQMITAPEAMKAVQVALALVESAHTDEAIELADTAKRTCYV